MGRIVVEVMPKPEILDPQGKAVVGSLPRLGFDQFTAVRQGRRFELSVDGPVTQAHLDAARQAADTLLSNPIIEDVVAVTELVEPAAGGGGVSDVSGADNAVKASHSAPGGREQAGEEAQA